MQADLSKRRKPKPNGELGFTNVWDPEQRSFKSAMITIVFAGMYLDAILYIALQSHFGRDGALKIERLPHEERLSRLGVTDPSILDRVRDFRQTRKDLVHEKAIELGALESGQINNAQDAADRAMALMREIRELLRVFPNDN